MHLLPVLRNLPRAAAPVLLTISTGMQRSACQAAESAGPRDWYFGHSKAGTVPGAAGSPSDLAFQPVKHFPLSSHCFYKLRAWVWPSRLATILLYSTRLLSAFVPVAHDSFSPCCNAIKLHHHRLIPFFIAVPDVKTLSVPCESRRNLA